ncbi:MAG: (2Fe-2S)-binding protein [Thermoplasmatota archaeon]
MKTLVCRCEDLTLDDCLEAIDDGYEAFEDLKRFLGLATGPCQGKACVAIAMQIIADKLGIDPGEVDVMRFRPPVRPIPLGTLAAEDA